MKAKNKNEKQYRAGKGYLWCFNAYVRLLSVGDSVKDGCGRVDVDGGWRMADGGWRLRMAD